MSDERTTAEVFASLDRMRAEDAAKAKRARKLEAELIVLEELDLTRRGGYGDFGAGQRATELIRRRRAIRDLGGDDYPERAGVDAELLEAAARKLLLPRLRRASARADEPRLRKYGRAQRATVQALRSTLNYFGVTA